MANITSQKEVTVSGLARVVEGIKTWVESSAAAHSAYRVHSLQEWGNVSARPDFGNYVFDAKYVNNEFQRIEDAIDEAASATSADMEVIAAALNDLDDRINATSGKADKVTGATAGHLAALDADGNLTDAGVTSGTFKTKQTPYTTSGLGTLKTITALTQNDNGEISATASDIQSASSSQKGVVQLATSIPTSGASDTTAATPKAVREAIKAAVANAYHHAGIMDASTINNSLLNADNEGNVYNITVSGYTNDNFLEGPSHIIRVGDNVGICKVSSNPDTYKFDLLSGFVDTSNFKTKQTAITSAASDALQTVQQIQQNENGELTITYQNIQTASTDAKGVVQLQGTIGASESENGKAATPKAVRDAITGAVNALDTTVSGASASKTLATLTETDGKIAATFQNIQIAELQVTNLTADLAAKAPLVSPALTGIPTAPTAAAGTSTTQIATTEFVQSAVSGSSDFYATYNVTPFTDIKAAVDAGKSVYLKVTDTYDDSVSYKYIPLSRIYVDSSNPDDIQYEAYFEEVRTTSAPGVHDLNSVTGAEYSVSHNQYGDSWWTTNATTAKVMQNAVSDPTASGTTLTAIDSITQDQNGEITATKKTIQDGTTSQKGVVQLQGSIGATETTDTKAATPKAVRDAINALDVPSVTIGASKTLAYISEANGLISTSAVSIQIAESQVADLTADLGKKADKVALATSGHLAMLDANGNLKDSGKFASDFATSAQGALADTAVQSISTNGTTWTKTGTNVVIPLATSASGGSAGIMSGPAMVKLAGIADGAEVNQNAFSNVKVGSTTVAADSKTATLEIVTSGNVTVSANASNDTILIGIPLMDETDVNNILNLLN